MSGDLLPPVGATPDRATPLSQSQKAGSTQPSHGRKMSRDMAAETQALAGHVADVAEKEIPKTTKQSTVDFSLLEHSIKKTFGRLLGSLVFKIVKAFPSLFPYIQTKVAVGAPGPEPALVPAETPREVMGKLLERRDIQGIKNLVARESPEVAMNHYFPVIEEIYGKGRNSENVLKEILHELPLEKKAEWNRFLQNEQSKMTQAELALGSESDLLGAGEYRLLNELRLICLNASVKEDVSKGDAFNRIALTKDLLQAKLDSYKNLMVQNLDLEIGELRDPYKVIQQLEQMEQTPEIEDRISDLTLLLSDPERQEKIKQLEKKKEEFYVSYEEQTQVLHKWSRGEPISEEQQTEFDAVMEQLFVRGEYSFSPQYVFDTCLDENNVEKALPKLHAYLHSMPPTKALTLWDNYYKEEMLKNEIDLQPWVDFKREVLTAPQQLTQKELEAQQRIEHARRGYKEQPPLAPAKLTAQQKQDIEDAKEELRVLKKLRENPALIQDKLDPIVGPILEEQRYLQKIDKEIRKKFSIGRDGG